MVSVTAESVKGNAKGVSKGPSFCACLTFLVCLGIAVLASVLVLDAYEYISVKAAKDTRNKLYEKIKELDPAVIEKQIGMKIINLDEYNGMVTEAEATKTEFETTKGLLAAKETEVTTITTDRDAIKGQLATMTNERDALTKQVQDLTTEKAGLTKQIEDLTAERDSLKKQNEEASAALAESTAKADGATTEAAADAAVRKLRG